MTTSSPSPPPQLKIPLGGGVSSQVTDGTVQVATSDDSSITYTADGQPLYDSASDTIYIYNALQTAVSRQDDAADQPVLTGDGDAETFGTGQPVYAEGSDEPLTYSPEHTYIYVDGWDEGLEDDTDEEQIAPQSVEEESDEKSEEDSDEGQPEKPAGDEEKGDGGEQETDAASTSTQSVDDEVDADGQPTTTAEEDASTIEGAEVLSDGENGETGKVLLADERAVGELDGRDYVGQVTKKINGETYILIGNEQQLRAIGSDAKVIGGPVYSIEQEWAVIQWKDVEGAQPTLLYPGDADLKENQTLRNESVKNDDGNLNIMESRYRYYALDAKGQEVANVEDYQDVNTGFTYSSDANYIIFRNIELTSDWTPLMFSGRMLGAVSPNGGSVGSLWDSIDGESGDVAVVNGTTPIKPVVSQINVSQNDDINAEEQQGVGFFASIFSETSISSDFIGSGRSALVSNISLSGVNVDNNAQEVQVDRGLLDTIVKMVGMLLDFATFGLLDLDQLFDMHHTDPSIFATGAFAGRIYGDVSVRYCNVSEISVANEKDMTGGFVGYVEGSTQYALGSALGVVVDGLTELLNFIPFLGLGTVVNWLLGSALGLNNLDPIGYDNPVIAECSVNNYKQGTILGSMGTSYAGGFVGDLIGARVENCSVTSENPYTVQAKNYAGGFVGLARNAAVGGLLKSLGVDLLSALRPQSLILTSSLDVTVAVSAESCAGGFAGAMANSYAVNTNLAGAGEVKAADNAGGFAGNASVGWGIELGSDDKSDTSLLGKLTDLVGSLVTGGEGGGDLLSLAGVKQSSILGTAMNAELEVTTSKDNAGGMVGCGTAVTIAASDEEHLNELSFWKYVTEGHPAPNMPEERATSIRSIKKVHAGGQCAGGIAGVMRPASVAAVLNSTVGVLDQAVPFEVSDVTVYGASTVSAEDFYAGGAIAYATGGSVSNVKIQGASSVSGEGNAGGFIGFSGPGGAVETGGLDILGLIKLSGLLSVAQYSAVAVRSCSVEGAGDGLTVKATGSNSDAGTTRFVAGGFLGQSNSTTVIDCHVKNLMSVNADKSGVSGGIAGGFVGYSTTGGLAEALSGDGESSTILGGLIKDGLLDVSNLLGAVPYMVPTYQGVDVSFVDGGTVTGDIAGGFAGDFQSGEVNEFTEDDLKDTTLASIAQSVKESPYAVINISKVEGGAYAGGFGGRVEAGSLADAADGGISILGSLANVKITDLVNLIQAYVPYINYAGVHSNEQTYADDARTQPADDKLCGFTVHANRKDDADSSSGSAGGFIGYGAAVQVSYCSVDQLLHTEVSEPADLEGTNGDTYFAIGNGEGKSEYAIRAPRYAGGYIGHLDIGSTAGVGSGLELLKGTGLEINLSDLVSALNVMASTLEHSNVYGATGGYAVLADGTDNNGSIGHAGGFAGKISGGQIQDCSSYNFSYIIGQIAAGGYAGEIEPGSVAKVLGEAAGNEGGLLDGLLGTNNLATLVQSFVPVIRNSETTCVPCGGAVRAQALTTEEGGADGSDTKVTVQRGMAGGYVGHSVGGQIWGNSSSSWKDEVDDDGNYAGMKREAAAVRIRSVYGAEYAGGFTGLMESGDTARAGGLNLLWGLVTVENLLSALSVVYPTEENTAVYGPLRGLSAEEWNSWVDYVGIHGGYGSSLAGAAGKVDPNATDDKVAAMLAEYVYGTHVVAGRQAYESVAAGGGAAGGYVGSMVTGTVTNGKAYDTKLVRAMRAAGGFAGAAEAGAAATLGSVGLLNGVLAINLNELVSAAQIFVPAIKNSSVEGYRLGMTVESSGSGSQPDDVKNATGNAGGYIGYGAGAQIWGDGSTASEGESDPEAARGCNVSGLRRVRAAAYAGGFAGKLTAGAAAKLNTDNASDGFLQQVLDALVGSTDLNDLVSVLKLSMSVVRGTTVTGFDEAWGYTVESYRDGSYPIAAGGYAGAVEATVLGKLNQDENALTANHVERLRGVDGGYYAGGFVGLADVGGVADVAAGSTEGSNVSILGLVGLNNVGVLQVFQPCIYGAGVIGVSDGVTVRAHNADSGSMLNNKRSSGNAGGFAGSVMSGTVQDSSVTNLNSVSGPSYTGGFIGYTGKSGVLDAEEADIESILGLSAEVINLFSTIVKNDTVTGIAAGYTVSSSRDALSDEGDSASDVQPISGGFIGFADLAHVKGCSASNMKRVGSDEIAGGFAGKTTFDYLVKLETNSPLVAGLLVAVNAIVEALRLDKLQNLDVIKINLGGEKFIEVGVLAEGNVAKISLFGLTIRIALSKESGPNREDVVTITIGDSSVELTCDKEGNISKEDISNLTVNLIKGNRSELDQCKVSGIADGYDVFGGGSQQDVDITETDAGFANGYAGGFVGLNDEGKLTNCEMLYADVIKGAASKTGPFSGQTHFESSYWFLTVDKLESGNTYHVYRANEDFLNKGVEGVVNGSMTVSVGAKDEADWTRFDVTGHRPLENATNHTDWENAYVTVPKSVAESPNGDGADEGEAEEVTQQVPLGVYASASKAVLMGDTAVTDNTGGLTPEPGDGQDPCEASVDLTLQKVWNDGIFGLVRPGEIKFVLYATYVDNDVNQHRLYYDPDKNVLVNEPDLAKDPEDNLIKPTVTVTKEDAESLWSSTWRKVIENLPVATEDGHYYTYHVEEIEVPGYDTSIGEPPDNKEQVITVTNTFKGMPALPGTGGTGTAFIMAAGLITLVVGGIWLDRQRRRRAAAQAVWRPTGTHFRD